MNDELDQNTACDTINVKAGWLAVSFSHAVAIMKFLLMRTSGRSRISLAITGLFISALCFVWAKFYRSEQYLRDLGCVLSCQQCNIFHPIGCERVLSIQEGTSDLRADGHSFADAASYLNVTRLQLGGEQPVSIPPDVMAYVHKIPLHTLDLSGTDCDDSSLHMLQGSVSLRHLILGTTYPSKDQGRNRIAFRPTQVTNAGLATIVRHHSIDALNLRDLAITDQGIESVAHMAIRDWNLTGTLVTDEVSHSFVSNASLKRVVFSEAIPSLVVSNCDPRSFTDTLVTAVGCERLQELRPKLQIVYPMHAMIILPQLPDIDEVTYARLEAGKGKSNELSPNELSTINNAIRGQKWNKVTGQLARAHDKKFVEMKTKQSTWRIYRYHANLLVMAWNSCYWAARLDSDTVFTVNEMFGELP